MNVAKKLRVLLENKKIHFSWGPGANFLFRQSLCFSVAELHECNISFHFEKGKRSERVKSGENGKWWSKYAFFSLSKDFSKLTVWEGELKSWSKILSITIKRMKVFNSSTTYFATPFCRWRPGTPTQSMIHLMTSYFWVCVRRVWNSNNICVRPWFSPSLI